MSISMLNVPARGVVIVYLINTSIQLSWHLLFTSCKEDPKTLASRKHLQNNCYLTYNISVKQHHDLSWNNNNLGKEAPW